MTSTTQYNSDQLKHIIILSASTSIIQQQSLQIPIQQWPVEAYNNTVCFNFYNTATVTSNTNTTVTSWSI